MASYFIAGHSLIAIHRRLFKKLSKTDLRVGRGGGGKGSIRKEAT
jgi:hypothetical protein